MRIALISDIHGNDVAFAAVAEDLGLVAPDEIVSLGDVAQGGPEPAATLERLAALEARTVMGNSDAFLLEVPTDSPEPISERHLEVREWSVAQLGESQLEYMRSFEPTVELDVDGRRILCFHGSPASYVDVLLPEWKDATLGPYEAPEGFDLLAGGHTHTQWTRRLGNALFVNPGSVGLAYDRHEPEDDLRVVPLAEYAVVFADELGLSVEFRRVPYSLARLREAVAFSGMPYAAEFAAEWRGLGDKAMRPTQSG
jgi:putative phosphoesterase